VFTNTPLSRVKRSWAKGESAAICRNRYLCGHDDRIRFSDFAASTSLGGRRNELAGKSVLLVAHDQLAAALALIELDGIAVRIILCPPGLDSDQLRGVMAVGLVDAIVSDGQLPLPEEAGGVLHVVSDGSLSRDQEVPVGDRTTEWVLLSSGTSNGKPKLVVHTLATLTAPISTGNNLDPEIVWGTFYDIRRYGGLQIFLRAIMGNGSLILSSQDEAITGHLARLRKHGVTHISGTPSHWRRVLMSGGGSVISPQYIRLSGEIADQPILDMLRATFENSKIVHAFASTEAGVAFEVDDGLAGFPQDYLGVRDGVEIAIENGSLLVRSDRTALRYLDRESPPLSGEDGFVDTGDMVERDGDRYHFLGRRNGVINIGGLKVHPEEIEAVINSHPLVAMSSVRARKNSIVGAVVAAEVVLKSGNEFAPDAGIEEVILTLCRQTLPPHKVPASLRVVAAIEVAEAGKLVRSNA
jgi:acyl-coenzyme A synthetase/AMP-(fatty) acid ligase